MNIVKPKNYTDEQKIIYTISELCPGAYRQRTEHRKTPAGRMEVPPGNCTGSRAGRL